MKRILTITLAATLFLPAVTLNLGCSDAQIDAFKTAASSGLSDGLKAIASALIDGAVAALSPNSSSQ